MLATQEQRRLASSIANTARHHPGHPDLPAMRDRLAQLGVRSIYCWSLTAMRKLPPAEEIAMVAAEARKLDAILGQPGGEGP